MKKRRMPARFASLSSAAAIERLERRELLSGSTPYTGTPFTPNQTILAVNYDKGGEGVAYHDTTSTNLGRENYRPGDAVDIQAAGSTGKIVAYAAAGEWLDYTINVPTPGVFTLQASVCNVETGGTFHGEFEGTNLGGTNLTGSMSLPNTGGWNTFTTITSSQFTLPAGKTVMRIVLDHAAANTAVGNFNWFKLAPVPTSTGGTSKPLVWTTQAAAPVGVFEAHSVTVNGKLYVFGGFNASSPAWEATNSAEVYNPATNKWALLAPMPIYESSTAVASDGKYIYVVGGYPYYPKTTFEDFGTTDDLRYDIATNTWTYFVPLPAPRAAGELDYLNGELHYFDGLDGVNATQTRTTQGTHWILDLSSPNPKWVTAAPVSIPRNHTASVVLNGKIYVMGGRLDGTDLDNPSATCLVWDPAHPNVWTPFASLPEITAVATAMVANGKIYLIGGTTTNYKAVNKVYVYDPATNRWSTQTPIPDIRFSPAGGVVGNMLIVTGGYQLATGVFETTTWTATVT